MKRRIRVLIAKPGLDGHDRGAKVIARALKEAGMEVIYTGLHQTPEQIVVGLSVLSGAHGHLFRRVCEILKERSMEDVIVFGGGIIPQEDIQGLLDAGVKALFTPGTTTREVIEFLEETIGSKSTS
jgi:methylmalonyl-CoA mutase C-terminal domain/subunit